MTSTDVEIVRRMSPKEYQQRLEMFYELAPVLTPYIKGQAEQKAAKLPVAYVDKYDLEAIGNAQVWIAVLRWDPKKGSSLVGWAKRLVWTNMSVMLDDLYQKKRTSRIPVSEEYVKDTIRGYLESLDEEEKRELKRRVVRSGNSLTQYSEEHAATFLARELHLEVTLPTVSLFEEVEDGVFLFETMEGESTDPIGALIADELYTYVRQQLLRQGKRVASGVLRFIVHPDEELLRLCEENARRRNGPVCLTNSCIASRLGISISKVADARAAIRKVFRECLGYDKVL